MHGATTQRTPTSESSSTACKFWGTEQGCKQGKNCRYAHPPLADGRDRCWTCSATGHRKAECPYKAVASDMAKSGHAASGGSGSGGGFGKEKGGKTTGKGKSSKQTGGKSADQPSVSKMQTTAEDKGKGVASGGTTSTQKEEVQLPGGQDQRVAEKAEENQTSARAAQQSVTPAGTGESESLMSEVTSLLRSMRVNGPRLSAMALKRVERTTNRTTLLDGGATHCLRPAANLAEWERSMECRVALATGSVELRQVPDIGTLITQDSSVQRIIPIRELVRMGLKVVWKDDTIEMTWQDGTKLPVWLDDGCPVVDDKVGKKLMKDIEDNNVRVAGIKKIWKYGRKDAGEHQCGAEAANDAMVLARLFPQVPHWLIGRIPGALEVDVHKIPFNRRRRKRIREAGTRILHIFSGEKTKAWTQMESQDLVVVCIEIERGTNFLDDNLFAYLLDMAKDGLWDMILAGPPCRTISLGRYRDDGGPRPLRPREGESRFGLGWNTPKQQDQCDTDSLLWLRTLYIMYVGYVGNPNLEVALEQPSDPEIWIDADRPRPFHGYASYLAWPETEALKDMLQLHEISFNQGALGHEQVKPTTLLSSVPETFELAGLRGDPSVAVGWAADLETRLEQSKKAAQWAPGLIKVLQKAILRKEGQSRYEPRPGQIRRNPGAYDGFFERQRRGRERLGLPPRPDERLAIRALDAKQLSEWKTHIANEHIPARRDCAQCLKNQGRDRPHCRTKTPSAFCLNLDVSGPFSSGHDQCPGTGPRYFLVGVYTVPVQNGVPLIERLCELGGIRQDDPSTQESNHGGGHQDGQLGPGRGGAPSAGLDDSGDVQLFSAEDLCDGNVGGDPSERRERDENLGGDPSERRERDANVGGDPSGERDRDAGLGGNGAVQEGERPREPQHREDLWERLAQGASPDEAISEVIIKELELENQRWQDEVAHLQDVSVCNLTIALPLKSRHANDIIEVTSAMYGRLRSFGLPLHRVHTDRAREFTSRPFAAWLRQRDVAHTTTGGDEHQGCARAEGEINVLKGRIRLLMDTAKVEPHFWPLALRHAGEQRFREQLAALGIRLPRLIPFGSQGMARFKRWHHVKDKDVWQHPMQKVTIYGPAYDMSLTSNGYYVECDGRWMRSTVVVQPRSPQPAVGRTLVQGHEELAAEFPEYLASQDVDYLDDELFDMEETDVGKTIRDNLDVVPQDDPPRLTHRLHGKQTWPPVLRSLRPGGECSGSVKNEVDYVEECKIECRTVEEVYEASAMNLLQLEELRKVEREEKAIMTSLEDAKLVLKLQRECNKLEHCLKALNEVETIYQDKKIKEVQETLVTRAVTLEEVRQDVNGWKEALMAEYTSLIDHGAIQPLSEVEFAEVKRTNEEVTTIPGMLVATLKPPNRRKARVVACGNYVQEVHDKQEVSAGGLDSIVTRSLVALASRKQWSIATADVKTAFLQAPRRATPGKATIISPPSILREAGVLQHGVAERWLVKKALYGLVESPRDWARYRDSQLRKMSWRSSSGAEVRVVPTAEPHLWEVKEVNTGEVKAYLGIYVDDIMVVGGQDTLTQVMEDLQRVFYMSPYEEVTEDHGVTFCGFEVAKDGLAYTLRQEKYVGELLQRRQVQGRENQPLPKIIEDDDEEAKDPRVINECQAIIGELQWLASRTRPDLCYATSLVARMIHRRPAYALGLCHYMLRYLAGHQTHGLRYAPDDEEDILHVRADTSFAPPHEQFRSVQGVAVFHGSHLLRWTSSRQAFVTLSTAEGELLGYTEAQQCGEAVGCLVQLFGYNTKKVLEGDSKAALCQVQSDGGSWRTRHLRLRAWKLREVMNDPNSQWQSVHVAGVHLAADGLTKSLQGQGHRRFISLLQMDIKEEPEGEKEIKIKKCEVKDQKQLHQLALILATAGATMVLDGSNQHLGTLMLMCSMVVKWWEGRKNHQEPSGHDQDLHGRKECQDPETRKDKKNNQEPQCHPHGKQDPFWATRNEKDGTQEVQDPVRTQGFSAASFVGQEGHRSPGLRAFRMNEVRGGDASSSAMGSSAQRRGVAALSGMSSSGDGALRGGYGVQGNEEAVLRGSYGASSGDGEALNTGIGLRGLDEAHGTESGSSGRAGIDSGPGQPPLRSGVGRDPWILEQFLHPPQRGSKDVWELGLLPEGWLVRYHKKLRKRWFLPLHQSLPVEASRLGTQRITVRVFQTGARMVTLDDWRTSTRTEDNREWRGYTFFKILGEQDEEDPLTSRTTRDPLGEARDPARGRDIGEHGDQWATRSQQAGSGRSSRYEGVWSDGQGPEHSTRNASDDRYGSRNIPPIEVNVTVNNYAGRMTTTSATTSRRSIMEEQQLSHGQLPVDPTSGSSPSSDDDGYSFVEALS